MGIIVIIIVLIFIVGLVQRKKDDNLLDTLGKGANFGCFIILVIAAIFCYLMSQS